MPSVQLSAEPDVLSSSQNPIFVEPAAPPRGVAPPPARDPVWTGRDVLVLMLVALLTLIFCGVVIQIYSAAFYPRQRLHDVPGILVISILAQAFTSAVVFGAMYGMVVRRYGRPFWETVRWNWPAGSRAALCTAGGVGLALLVDLVSALLPVPKELPIYKLFTTTASAYAMAGYGILLAPVIEELFFRGFLFPVLVRRQGLPLAVLLTSFAFTLIHASQLGSAWLPLVILFFVGMAFTLARAWTGSVAAPYLMHVAYNATLFAGLFFSTGYFRHMEKMTQ